MRINLKKREVEMLINAATRMECDDIWDDDAFDGEPEAACDTLQDAKMKLQEAMESDKGSKERRSPVKRPSRLVVAAIRMLISDEIERIDERPEPVHSAELSEMQAINEWLRTLE